MNWQDLLLGLGLAAVLEGLVLALAPLRLEQVLEALRRMTPDARRMMGVGIIGLGVLMVWLARG